jgi:hypothetical protein
LIVVFTAFTIAATAAVSGVAIAAIAVAIAIAIAAPAAITVAITVMQEGVVPLMIASMMIFFCSNLIAQPSTANQCPPRNFLQAVGLIAKPNRVYDARLATTRSTL